MSALDHDHDADVELLAAAALDPEDLAHAYADAAGLAEARATGRPVLSLCGLIRTVPRDPEWLRGRPTCELCAELAAIVRRARDLCGGER